MFLFLIHPINKHYYSHSSVYLYSLQDTLKCFKILHKLIKKRQGISIISTLLERKSWDSRGAKWGNWQLSQILVINSNGILIPTDCLPCQQGISHFSFWKDDCTRSVLLTLYLSIVVIKPWNIFWILFNRFLYSYSF